MKKWKKMKKITQAVNQTFALVNDRLFCIYGAIPMGLPAFLDFDTKPIKIKIWYKLPAGTSDTSPIAKGG